MLDIQDRGDAMRWIVTALCALTAILGAGDAVSSPAPPREIAGYRLGTNISEYGSRVRSETVFTVRLRPYLKEVAVSVPEGFTSGYVVYGDCDTPGAIVRIKVKYQDDRRVFFDKLLDALKKRFGPPDQYIGDPFQAYVAWRWDFDVSTDEKITMIVSHYDGDDEEHTQGNALKLTLNSQMVRESRCDEARAQRKLSPDAQPRARTRRTEVPPDAEAWRRYLPNP